MNVIDDLKKYRAPLWARWLGDIRARKIAKRQREQHAITERLIGTVNWWVWLTDMKQRARISYTLIERGDGRRRYVFATSHPFLAHREKATNLYIDVVLPWMMGADTDGLMPWIKATSRQPAWPDDK